MRYRRFGSTDLNVSELGFGGWAIGGSSYGTVDRTEALRALAVAEELGCNLVDTAGVYGDSERVIGEFLRGRRGGWYVATKYSGQTAGLVATVEEQLTRLGVEAIDFYQLHWVPRDRDDLYEDLHRLKAAGKVRFVGVSLYSDADVDHILSRGRLDGIQVACSLLDPQPLVRHRRRVAAAGIGILVRSALRGGFLTGKYDRDARFTDPADQRTRLPRRRIKKLVGQVERFRFLASEHPLRVAAVQYPLAFPEVGTVLLGTKNETQARENFGPLPPGELDGEMLAAIEAVQRSLGVLDGGRGGLGVVWRAVRHLLGR